MGWDGTERREMRRFGVKRLGITYSKTRLLAFASSYSEKYLVLNVSEGGMYFMTKEELAVGQNVAVRLDTPKAPEMIVKGTAEVMWKTKSQDHEAWKVGVQFSKLSDKALTRLRELIGGAILDKVDVSTTIYLREVERL